MFWPMAISQKVFQVKPNIHLANLTTLMIKYLASKDH